MLVVLMLCLTTCAAIAQQEALPPLDQTLVTFEQIVSPNLGRIISITRDERGFIWFGTTLGLCKYDGYTVRSVVVGPSGDDDPHRVDRNSIRGMIRMRNGSLLLATNFGLWIVDPTSERSEPLPGVPELSDQRMNTVVEDRHGTIWIGTVFHGLYAYAGEGRPVKHFDTANGLSDNHVSCLLAEQGGNLWVGTIGGGLSLLDPATSRFVRYRKGEMLSSDHITAIGQRKGGEIWIGTDEGLYCLDSVSHRFRSVDIHSATPHTISGIVGDSIGGVWIGVQELGLCYVGGGTLTRCAPADDMGRSLNAILCLNVDTAASGGSSLLIWAGTRTCVDKIVVSRNPFATYVRDQRSLQLDRGAVLSFSEDSSGVLWTGLWGGGVNGFKPSDGSYRRVARFAKGAGSPVDLPDNDITALHEDRQGNLWAGTPHGLAALDRRRMKLATYKHADHDPTSLAHNAINRIYEDHAGTLWFCTEGGLSVLEQRSPPRFKNYLNNPAEAHPEGGNQVTDMLEDRDGHYWVSTYGKGLLWLGPDSTVTRFLCPGDSSGATTNWISGFDEGRDGRLWLSTRGGLVSFDRSSGTFTRWPIDELAHVHIFSVLEDTRGELWMSTSIGLARFSPATRTLLRFQSRDGFPFEELFSPFFRTQRGTYFVGGIDGFAEFSPETFGRASHPPEIAITEFAVFDKPLASTALAGGDIHLAHDENFFSLTFAALDYVSPHRNRFSYRMEGVDVEWIDAGARNYVRYTHLDPGNYVFRVRGCNSENVWNESGASVAIVIAPPFWQLGWVRLLGVILAGSAIYALYRYRLRSVVEVERLRLRIADDLHDDVGSNLSAIAMVSRVIQQAPELSAATRRRLAEIYDTAVTTSEGMKDIVWFIKPKSDTLDDLLLRMKDTTSFLLADIQHDFRVPESSKSVGITVEFKRNFFLAFKEILNNIVKHASATRVEVQVERREGMLEAVISDNGRGFDPANVVRRGNGLASLRNRAERVGGAVVISSRPGEGTAVRFSGRI